MNAFKSFFCFILIGVLVLLSGSGIWAKQQKIQPEKLGISGERLSRLDRVMQGYVDENKLSGIVTLIARRGKIVHLKAIGKKSIEAGEAMKTDSIFRLYSMTKPVTSVALLMLYEKGLFQLTDPVENYIPEFKALKVFDSLDKNGQMVLADQKRKMTIQDLFRHTSGLSYGDSRDTPVNKAYYKAGIGQGYLMLSDLVIRLSTVPLLYQPGTKWSYSYAHDVQAFLVEILSGMPFDEYLEKYIFKPLNMKDTSFGLPSKKIKRFTTSYGSGPNYQDDSAAVLASGLIPIDTPETSDYLKRADYPAGGTGLVSTAEDYFRFCQMLLNRGELNGVRLLSPKTIELMTMDNVPEGADRKELSAGKGYGLGVSVLLNQANSGNIGSAGQFGWMGMATTYVIIDPAEKMISIMFTQIRPMNTMLMNQFQTLVYQAVIE